MWYVIQVRSGSEEGIVKQCEAVIGKKYLEKCFVPYYEQMKKYKGEWHKVKKLLFPGYVFMISDVVDRLYFELKSIEGLTKIIGMGNEVVPLNEEEIAFLTNFGKDEQVVEVSQGIVESGTVVITQGPLMGFEGFIKRIDRHKRVAYLEVELMGQTVETRVGLEIVIKK